MAETKTTSKLFSWDWKDAGKGLIVAVVSAVLTAIYDTLQQGSLKFDWKHIGIVAATTAAAYLLKNFFTAEHTIKKV